MQLFFDPDIPAFSATAQRFVMNQEESWHCIKVLRMRTGGEIKITDGRGSIFTGKLIVANPDTCEVEILSVETQAPLNYSIHLAVSPIKNMSRYEWFLEKATEIGITTITPLICDRTEKAHVRHERLKKLITSAMKQSMGVFHPLLKPVASFNDFVASDNASEKFIAWCETKDEPLLSKVCPSAKSIAVLIGPEGDFTPEEVKKAKNAGYLPISLGENRLRTETAALAACFVIHTVNGTI